MQETRVGDELRLREVKDPRNGLPLCGQSLFFVCILERGASAHCRPVNLWLLACTVILGTLMALQGIQAYIIGRYATHYYCELVRYIVDAFHSVIALQHFLCTFLLIHCFVGIGVHNRSAKCSLTNPLLWWTGFYVSSSILLMLISQLFIFVSGVYLRKTLLRRGIGDMYFSTDGTDELMRSDQKGRWSYGVVQITKEAFEVHTIT